MFFLLNAFSFEYDTDLADKVRQAAEDGCFYEADGRYEVGDIIEYNAEKSAEKTFETVRRRTARRVAAVAACLVLLLSGALYSYNNLIVYADMTLGGDMPVVCGLNRKRK